MTLIQAYLELNQIEKCLDFTKKYDPINNDSVLTYLLSI